MYLEPEDIDAGKLLLGMQKSGMLEMDVCCFSVRKGGATLEKCIKRIKSKSKRTVDVGGVTAYVQSDLSYISVSGDEFFYESDVTDLFVDKEFTEDQKPKPGVFESLMKSFLGG